MKKQLIFASVAAACISLAAAELRTDFRIRDPFVLTDNGTYYLYESKPWFGGKGVSVRTSTDLEHWSEKRPAMDVPKGVPVTAVWAPEVHKYQGAYYLFTTLTEKKGSAPIQAMDPKAQEGRLTPRGTWIFKSESPLGPFKPVKMGPVPPKEWMTLDGTLYVEDGQPYMVFCHEWCQVENGRMCYAPLAKDFASFTAPPKTLFAARDAVPGAGHVTDGPFFYRSPKNGDLYMIWSNFIKGHGYCVLLRKSTTGKLAGPWGKDEILYGKNGGHGMIFRTFDGKLLLTLHQPNSGEAERMKLFELEDTGNTLRLVCGTFDMPPMPSFGVCAHQGNGGGKPANTVVAFTNAVALGAIMVEFDVKRCKTGELVIMHDGTVDRTTNGKGAVSALTFDEIRKLTIKWPGHPDANVKVPTFDEAIDCLPTEGVWINCHSAANVAVEVAQKIKAKGRLHQAFVATSLPAIEEARKAVPDILTCNMSRTVKGLDAYHKPWPPEKNTLYAKQTIEHKCQFLQLLYPCSRADVEMLHAAGVKVSYFKCDKPEKAKQLRDLGIDVILSDRIEVTRPAFTSGR
jgi:glycerophosphoryl diester phosphodiesterase/GH43 family beta-xylosidase